MANLGMTLRFEEEDCGLQTLRNVCQAAMLYLDMTQPGERLLGAVEVELMRDLALEVEACAGAVFEMEIDLHVVSVTRGGSVCELGETLTQDGAPTELERAWRRTGELIRQESVL